MIKKNDKNRSNCAEQLESDENKWKEDFKHLKEIKI